LLYWAFTIIAEIEKIKASNTIFEKPDVYFKKLHFNCPIKNQPHKSAKQQKINSSSTVWFIIFFFTLYPG